MSKGIAIISGSAKVVHRFLQDGTATISGSLEVTGSVLPQGDGTWNLGSGNNRWSHIYAVDQTVGAILEAGLTTPGIEDLPTGTVLVWKDGGLKPCDTKCDKMVMGVAKNGKQQPIILGAEPVLVTGLVKEGDYIVTSEKPGHGEAYKFKKGPNNLFGKVIAQALENADGDSNLIKCMINKM